MNIVIGLLTVILVVVCLLIVLVVLMQRPKQEGLGAAFGGGMTDQMFGAQTTNVLQKFTVYLAVLFFGITLVLSVLVARKQNRTAALGTSIAEEKVDPVDTMELPGLDTGAQLLSDTPLDTGASTTIPVPNPVPAEGATPPSTEGSAAPVEDETTKAPVEAPTVPESIPAPSGDAADAPADTEAAGADDAPVEEETEAEESPAENTDAAGETPNL